MPRGISAKEKTIRHIYCIPRVNEPKQRGKFFEIHLAIAVCVCVDKCLLQKLTSLGVHLFECHAMLAS